MLVLSSPYVDLLLAYTLNETIVKFCSYPLFSSAKNALWGISTLPTIFIRALPRHQAYLLPCSMCTRRKSAGTGLRRYVFRFNTSKNADCGISTCPTIFIRALPFFCFFNNLSFRVLSPP